MSIARSTPSSARSAASQPSWGRVLATTIRLWVVRARGWRAVAAATAAAVVIVAALAVSGVFTSTAAPVAQARAASTLSPAKAVTHPVTPSPASVARAAAAVWIAGQLSGNAIIACDPAMCAALQAGGVSAARLMPVQPGSPTPHSATVVVSSASASEQLAAFAPAVIASFGSGGAQVDVRAVEPGGAAGYQAALRADLAARMSAGSQLLQNNRIRFTPQDAAELRAGQVDTRLLATLAALSSEYSFTVTAFGDAAPGVATLYREVSIAGDAKSLPAALALVKAQIPPFMPARAAITQPAADPAVLTVGFAAPSPLGLLTAVLDVNRSLNGPARD